MNSLKKSFPLSFPQGIASLHRKIPEKFEIEMALAPYGVLFQNYSLGVKFLKLEANIYI
jgi:hypothetical protein|tara:strand:+ start:179 stop:355 length:177 start_codon:yes stop_codon:yes gene_type:complete